jgi:hypothetical protein
MVFGITEFGRAFYQYNTLAKAIRDGARYIIKQEDLTKGMGNAKNLVVYGNTTGTGTALLPKLVPANVEIDTAALPDYITVKITGYQFQSLVPGVIPLKFNLSPSITMPYLFTAP